MCDTAFDDTDAAVACDQVVGFTRDGTSVKLESSMTIMTYITLLGAKALPRGSHSSGTGPIYLSELECDGSEFSLSSCLTGHNLPPGLVNCNHSMDVIVQCEGESACICCNISVR